MSNATIGIVVPLEAKPGQGQALSDLLVRGKKHADAESETLQWYAVKISDTKHAVFNTFSAESARETHLTSSKAAEALKKNADAMLTGAPKLAKVEIIASLVRPVSDSTEPKFGVYVPIHAKPEKAEEVKQFLINALSLVEAEPETTQWFAFRKSETEFGILDAAATESGREAHLKGKAAEGLKAGKDLLTELPNIQKCEILAFKVTA